MYRRVSLYLHTFYTDQYVGMYVSMGREREKIWSIDGDGIADRKEASNVLEIEFGF